MRALLIAAMTLAPTLSSATETIDQLSCGTTEVVMHSECVSNAAGVLLCARQMLTTQLAGSTQANVPLAGRVAAIGDSGGKALDKIVQSWACVTGRGGVRYLLLDYSCTPGSSGCDIEAQREETYQLLTLTGQNLNTRGRLDAAEGAATLEKAGLSHLFDPPGTQMTAIRFEAPRPGK